MNATFVAVGVATLLAAWHKLLHYPLLLLLIGAFAISLALTGFYRHEPLVAGIESNDFAARRHSLFATTTGVSFVAFAVAMSFVSRTPRDRLVAIGVAVAATLLSLGIATVPDLMGLFQRAMFLMAFGWLVYVTSDRYRLA